MLFDESSGNTPLLVNVPHAGTDVPQAIAESFTAAGGNLPDTDWHVHRLVAGAAGQGVSLLNARYSRYVIDLNRGRDDRPLYGGATTGLVPTDLFDGRPVYAGAPPDNSEMTERIELYWQPYHDKLKSMLDDIRRHHGFAVLFDVHSIRSAVPRLFDGRLPDLNLGTFDGQSCAADLQETVGDYLAECEGFSSVVNGRFKGGFITRHYGRPDDNVHALQLEIAQDCYMDEDRPAVFDPERAAPLVEVLDGLIRRLAAWSPA